MDPATITFYNAHAPALAARYNAAPEGISALFREAFDGRSSILDVGCGSGRDVRRLLNLGFNTHGVDASEAMIAHKLVGLFALDPLSPMDGTLTALQCKGIYDYIH